MALSEGAQALAQSLWFVSGKSVVVRCDGGKEGTGNTAVTFRDVYPRDLAPMIILDASGRVRGTYELLIKERGLIEPLKMSTKNYANLDCKVWTTPGSKSGWRNNSDKLIEGICRTIREEPERNWLIVLHKPEGPAKGSAAKIGDIAKLIREELGPVAKNISFTTWGKDVATNDYRDCDRIILGGTLFYRLSQYEALTHLASGHKAKDGRAPTSWLDKVTIGESRDQVLQAASRGAIRYSDGDECAPAKLFIIASAHSGIRNALPVIFPGCRVGDWEPVVKMLTDRLRGYEKAAHDELKRWVAEDGKGAYTFARMKKAIGLRHAGNFRRLRLDKDFQEAIGNLGLVEHKPKKYASGWRLA